MLGVFPDFHRDYRPNRGEVCALAEIERQAMEHYFDDRRPVMTDIEREIFDSTSVCKSGLQPFDLEMHDVVRAVDHVTGGISREAHM